MKRNEITAAILIVILIAVSRAHAGQTGAAFLSIGAGSRAVGMGSAFTAVADDASAVYWNPGGISKLNQREALLMHSDGLLDMNYNFASFVAPFSGTAVGLSAFYLSEGKFEGRDDNRQLTPGFSASDTSVALTVGHSFPGFRAGTSIKAIRQQIADASAMGFAVDGGIIFDVWSKYLSCGATIQNVGPSMKFTNDHFNLPETVSIGLAGHPLGILTVAADARKRLISGETEFDLGTEFMATRSLSLRAGYLSSLNQLSSMTSTNVHNSIDGIGGFTGGVGIRFRDLGLDYAMVPYSSLGRTQQISITSHF